MGFDVTDTMAPRDRDGVSVAGGPIPYLGELDVRAGERRPVAINECAEHGGVAGYLDHDHGMRARRFPGCIVDDRAVVDESEV